MISSSTLPAPRRPLGPRASEGHLLRDLVGVLKDQVSTLQHHLEIREREVGELHVIFSSRPWPCRRRAGTAGGGGEKFGPGVTEQRN